MFIYLIKLVLILALVSAMAVGSLWLMRRYGARVGLSSGEAEEAPVTLIAQRALGPTTRLAVVAFGGEHFLLSVTRAGVGLIARTPVADAARKAP